MKEGQGIRAMRRAWVGLGASENFFVSTVSSEDGSGMMMT